MKNILLLLIVFGSFANAQMIGTNRLKDESVTAPKLATGSVTQDKLSEDALRPSDEGVLSDPALVFGTDYRKNYTLSVTSDIALSLSGSAQREDSYIFIKTIPDGQHSVTFPTEWSRENDNVFDPTKTQRIELYYDGITVYVKVLNSTAIIIPVLVTAIMDEGTDDLTLTFDNLVTITTAGWTVTASGGAATVSSVVSGSGTPVIVFDLSRNITSGETMSISYNPSTGNTLSSTGNEISTISNFIVDTGEGALPSNAIFVDDDAADDVAAGTVGDPFKTGQAGSNAANTGQVVLFRTGTYRETIVAKNGVKYQNYPGETATISGLNTADGGWTVHSGSIYKKTITLPVNGFLNNITSSTTLSANQIFKDGVMQFQARWPKASSLDDLLDRTKFRHHSSMSGFGQTSLTDTGIGTLSNLPNGTWANGTTSATPQIFMTGWFIAQTRPITSKSGNVLNYPAVIADAKFRKWYYITNHLSLLTQAKEWHYDGTILYFWQTGNGTPTGIEYKVRNWGFDIRGKDNVEITGLTFIGCEPATGDVSSDNNIIDNIRASYTNHAFIQNDPDVIYNSPKQNGMKLMGNNNTVKNSEFHYTSSQLIWAGPGTIIQNNLATDISYEGNYGAFVTPAPAAGNIKILNNTVSRVGRSHVDYGYVNGEHHDNIEVGYNHFYDYLMINNDGGSTYAARGVRLNGGRIHHNWIHGNAVDQGWNGPQGGANYDGIHVGIYFDQGTGPTTVDHNVLWDNAVADYYSQVISTVQNIYNNTFAHTDPRESYHTAQLTPTDVMRNNIFRNQINIAWNFPQNNNNASQPGDIENSLFNTTDPLFVGSGGDGLNYRIQTGSPAKNTGVVIPGITDDAVGLPDMGAYEFGGVDWVPGYDQVVSTDAVLLEDNNATFTTYSAGKTTFSNAAFSGGTASFFNTVNATVTVNMTGTAFEWYAEKYNTAARIEVSVDGVVQDCDAGTGGTQNCDLYENRTDNNSTLIFSKTGMSAGAHTLVFEIIDANGSSLGTNLTHDAVKVTAP